MEVTVKVRTTKVAWIRDPEPPGKPAPGHLPCICGGAKLRCNYDKNETVVCPACGTTYNGEGWILY